MPENDPGDKPSRSEPDASNGADLDALLSEAADMATDLRREVGEGEAAPPVAGEETAPLAEGAESPPAVDDQLNRVEGLLEEAESALGRDGDEADTGSNMRGGVLSAAPPTGEKDPLAGFAYGAPIPDLPDGDAPFPDLTAADVWLDEPAESYGEAAGEDSAPAGFSGRAAAMLCMTLDLIDRPFVRIRYRTRQLAGVAAMVTLIAAVVTFILSRL